MDSPQGEMSTLAGYPSRDVHCYRWLASIHPIQVLPPLAEGKVAEVVQVIEATRVLTLKNTGLHYPHQLGIAARRRERKDNIARPTTEVYTRLDVIPFINRTATHH